MDGLSPQDRDLLVRTVIGEADSEPDAGKAAVAHVVLNRLNSGNYGKSIPDVLLAPKQFEPWSNPQKMMAYSPDSPSYKKASNIVDNVLAGNVDDPTGGATNFANVDTVQARGNNSAMGWIKGMTNVSQIGSHTFGNADGPKMASKDNYSDLIKEFGGTDLTPKSNTDSKSNTNDTTNYDDLVKEFGGSNHPVAAIAPAGDGTSLSGPPTVENIAANAKKYGASNYTESSPVMEGIKNLPSSIATNVTNDAQSAKNLLSGAVTDYSTGRVASAVGKAVLGVAGGMLSPITGASKSLIQEPVTQLTGNPEVGERANFVATSGFPVNKLGAAVKAALPEQAAVKNIVDAIGTENLPDVINRLKSNPRLSVYDVSPGVQQMTQKLVVTPGPHQNDLISAIQDRASGAKDAIQGAYNDTMGAPVNVLNKINDMKQAARDTGAKIINPIVENSKPANITGVINNLDEAIANSGPVGAATLKALKNGETPSLPLSETQNKLFQIRQQLRGDWQDRPNMFLDVAGEQGAHKVQSSIRAEAQDLINSPNPQDRQLGGKLMNIRGQLVDAIDNSSSGYKNALGKYADDMQVQDAFTKGQEILSNRPTNLNDRPEYWQDWAKNAKPAELQAAKEGARVAIDNKIRGFKAAARGGTDVPQVEFNADKLKVLFGEKEVTKLTQKLQDERAIADSNSKLLQNSQTAMRLKNDSRVDVPVHQRFGTNLLPPMIAGAADIMGGSPGLATGAYLAASGAKRGIDATKIALAKGRNSAMTNMLTATGPSRDELINQLSRYVDNSKPSILQRTTNKLQNVIAP